MWKLSSLLLTVLMLEMVIQPNALVAKRRGKKPKRMKAGDVALQLSSLQKNVSTLWTEMQAMDSSRVMVHVHGLGDDPAETHEQQDGTHVHIHMHLDGHGDHEEGDQHDGHGHRRSGCHHMDKMEGMEGVDMGDHSNHGHHGMTPAQMMGKMKGKGHMMKMKHMHSHMHLPAEGEYVSGRCEMAMNPNRKNSRHNIAGSIHLRQKMHGPMEILLHLTGFNMPTGAHAGHSMHTHGFHVHQFGDSSNGCESFGGHYDPDGVDHAGNDAESRHSGDWGNIACDDDGEVHTNTTDSQTSIIGTHSIMGRGIVIHENVDDMGQGDVAASLKTGNAGGRLACCVVAWSDAQDWDMLLKHQH